MTLITDGGKHKPGRFSFSSVHTSVLYYLTTCQWPCLSPCGQLCHRWSITIGGGLLLAKAHRLTDPDKSAVNASSQLNALIGSDRHSGPYASFMPPGPQKSSVGRYVMCVYVYILFLKNIQHSAPAVRILVSVSSLSRISSTTQNTVTWSIVIWMCGSHHTVASASQLKIQPKANFLMWPPENVLGSRNQGVLLPMGII